MKKRLLLVFMLAVSFVLLCGFAPRSNVVDLETPSTSTGVTTEAESTEASDDNMSTDVTTEAPDNSNASTNGSTTEYGSNIGNDIMSGDYEFGDDIVSSDEDMGGFFQRLYGKLLEGLNGFQVIVVVILSIMWVICLAMLAFSIFANPKKVLWYILALLLIAVIIVVVIYAVPILNSFRSWFMK